MYSQAPSSSSKPHLIFPASRLNDPPKNHPLPTSSDFNMTAAKRQDPHPIYTQHTTKPQRKILLYGQDRARFLFPLVRDRDIGIDGAYQNIVIESVRTSICSATTMTGRPQAPNCSAASGKLWRTCTRCFPRRRPLLTIPNAVIELKQSNSLRRAFWSMNGLKIVECLFLLYYF